VLEGVRVFVVVPAFNEAMRLPRVVESMPREVDHVIVVDDASTDGTTAVSWRSGGARLVIVIRHDTNRGVGAAIATGYRRALSMPGGPRDAFVVMAGDGQMDPRDLPALVSPIARREADYVKGNRFAHPTKRAIPITRRAGGLFFSVLTSAAIGLRVHDSQCGFTAISREACEKLDLDALWPRFGYPNDLLGMLVRADIPIAERPVAAVYPHARNKLGARHVPTIAAITLRAWKRRVWG
jgi:glycosyltransferase involved in cell wall biosynthesis